MQILCKNIGMIEEARINLNGLTIIAGENDTGKTTLSKLLFAIIKASDRSDINRLYLEEKKLHVKKIVDELYFITRANLITPDDQTIIQLRDSLNSLLLPKILQFVELPTLDQTTVKEKLNILLKTLLTRLQIKLRFEYNNLYTPMINKLSEIITRKVNPTLISESKFYKYLNSLFDNEICNRFGEGSGEIVIGEGDIEIIKVKVNCKEQCQFYLLDELYFNEVTLVESPLVLQLFELIYNARTSLESNEGIDLLNDKPFVNIHIKDLINKLRHPNLSQTPENDEIEKIINGNLYFDEDDRCFVLEKKGQRFKAMNIASGIKSFGILQILLKKGFLRERAMLILDEPEVNMHPKWQVQYAELLVQLVKKLKVKVLLTSHSPYFIEAIKVFSDKHDFSKKTTFYLTEKTCGTAGVKILNVTNDLDRIFTKLTEPFEDLEKEALGDWL